MVEQAPLHFKLSYDDGFDEQWFPPANATQASLIAAGIQMLEAAGVKIQVLGFPSTEGLDPLDWAAALTTEAFKVLEPQPQRVNSDSPASNEEPEQDPVSDPEEIDTDKPK